MTNPIKTMAIKLFAKFIKHRHIEYVLSSWLKRKLQIIPNLSNTKSPYSDVKPENLAATMRSDTVFITGRFRSGSTLLWNMFRQLPSCTSYYEPFNERQWFNQKVRGNNTDQSHLNVNDYWQEYSDLEHLSDYYKEDWIKHGLHMDEETYAPDMTAYISELITAAKKRPVLQFNRIDFRLSWLKKTFPNAKVIHIYRNPREQWISTFRHHAEITKDNVIELFPDGFYLDLWCQDLQHHFPFLDNNKTNHPYKRFYYLWKLSYLYGCEYSDLSIQFEELVKNSEAIGKKILKAIDLDADYEKFTAVIENMEINTWQEFADNAWFETLEQECEKQLSLFLARKESD